MASARNRPRGHLALLILAVLALLAVLAARVDAAPAPEPEEGEPVAEVDVLAAATPEPARVAPPGLVPVSIATMRALAASAPPASSVVAAAYRAAGLDGDPGPGWRARTRLAGLVPIVTLRQGEDSTWREIADPTIGHVHMFDVRATWRLDRLLFDPNELRISAIEYSRRRERRHLAATVIHLYYEWLRARASDAPGSVRVEETAAELDAITDGWFSQNATKARESR